MFVTGPSPGWILGRLTRAKAKKLCTTVLKICAKAGKLCPKALKPCTAQGQSAIEPAEPSPSLVRFPVDSLLEFGSLG